MSWCYLSMKLPPPLRGVMGKPCPHGQLTNESPCFREEGTFLSTDGHQALGCVLEFLDFLDLPGSSLPQGCLSVVWPGLGRVGWWLMDEEEDFLSLISTSLLMVCLGVRSFGVFLLCGRSSLESVALGGFQALFPRELASPRLSSLGHWRMLVSCWSAILDFGSVSLEAFLCSPPRRPFLFFGSHILSSTASALFGACCSTEFLK